MNLSDYTSKFIDYLGLVSALCQELGIAEFIDNQIPNQSEHRHISYGQLNDDALGRCLDKFYEHGVSDLY